MDVTKYNHEKLGETFKDTKGINFSVENAHYSGATHITTDSYHVYDGDPIPDEWDGGGNDYIDIVFHFEGGGEASVRFCPDMEHCEVTKEMGDL
jgi:hypothetical protein